MNTPPDRHAPDKPSTQIQASSGPFFQTFQASDHPYPVQIPVVRHPTTSALYVIWTDITDCFPRAIRIQHGDVYVPFLRDQTLCRVRPHGIKYHPDVVLDVIYNEPVRPLHQQQRRTARETHRQNSAKSGRSQTTPHDSDNSHGDVETNGHVLEGHNSTHRNSPSDLGGFFSRSRSHSPQTVNLKAGTSIHGNESENENGSDNENEDESDDEKNDREDNDEIESETRGVAGKEQEEPLPPIILSRSTSPRLVESSKLPQDRCQHNKPAAQQDQSNEKTTGGNTSTSMDVHKEQTLGTSHDNSAIAAEATSASALKDSAVVANKDATDKDDHSKKKKSAKSRTIPATEVQQKPQTTRDSKSNDYDQTVQRLETGLPDPVPPSTVSNKPQRLPDGQLNTLTHADIARRRAEQLLRRRYRWIESCAPKLFVLLPNNYATSTKTEADFDDAYVSSLNWTDFAVHFLCDCGGIPGFENLSCPHWTLKEYPWGHPITNTSERSIIDRFASYMVCILEVFKYGVDLDLDSEDGGNNPNTNGHGDSSSGNNRSRINIPAETDPDLRKRIELAIRYLQSKGARTSDDFLNVAERYTPESLALECVVPVSPPIKANLSTMKSLFFSDNRRAIDDTHPYLTQERDVRWVCLHHYSLMTPQAPWTTALKYSNDTAPSSSEFRACMGAFRAVITTRERAREYYRLGEQLTTICVLRLFLDWDLTQEDEEELRVAVSKFPAVCVRIQVRAGSMYTGIVPGFGHGYSAIIFEALKNTKIEAFVMDQGAKDEPAFYGYDERYDVKRSFSARDALVRFKRSAKKNKMNLRILVTDIDRGILRIRKVFEGLHHFTKLSLIISDIWEYVTITFLKPGMPGYDIEDTDYMSNRPLTFFEKRGNMDSITYNCRVMGDNQFLQSKALTSLSLGFIYSRDRNKVRDVLKNNKRLQKIELENLVQDDPSQIYESFKALLVNHPTLDKIEVKQRHTRSSSDFVWRDVSDPAKMSVMVTMYEGDKVASMFQKYATSLRRINICGISIQDASVLEKVLRPKKGPFKLKSLTIIDAHLVEAAALEDLKKIITRGDIEEVKIFGDAGKIKSDKELETERMDHNNSLVSGAGAGAGHHSMADKGSNHKGRIRLSEKGKQKLEEEAAIKMRDFVMSISAKITGLCIWSNSCHRILDALDKKRPYSPIMPMLSSFSASGMHKRILDYRWLAETLLYKSAVIRKVMNEYTKVRGSSGNSNNSNFSHSIKDLSIGSDAALGSVKDIGIPSPGSIIATAIEICPVQVVPLDDLSLQDFEVQPEDWGFLLSVLDFSRLRTFRLDLVNEVTGEMLDMLADVIPSGAPLESFSISVPGPTAEESMMCQQKIKKKVEGGAAGTSRTGTGAGAGEKDKHVAILVNGFIG